MGCERSFGFRRCQLPADLRHRQKMQAAVLLAQTEAGKSDSVQQRRRAPPAAAAVVEMLPQTVEYKNDLHWGGPAGSDDSAVSLSLSLCLCLSVSLSLSLSLSDTLVYGACEYTGHRLAERP